jgi:subfamily B ATP-binding cassette protein MsbA
MNPNGNREQQSFALYKKLKPYMRPHQVRLYSGILCAILHGGATFGMLVALRWALGGISGESLEGITTVQEPVGFTGDVSVYRITFAIFLLPAAAILKGALLFIGRYYIAWVGNRVITELRNDLFQHIHALPIQFVSGNRVGELISRLTSDTTLLMNLVTQVFGDLIRAPFTLIGCLAAMIYLEWRLAFISFLVFPLCILPIILLGKRVRSASKLGQESTADMLSVAQESISGALIVKAFQTENHEVDRFRDFNMRAFKMNMKQLRANICSEPIMYILSSLAISGVVFYAFKANMSLALLMTFVGAAVQMYKPLKQLSQIHLKLEIAAPGAERVFSVLEIESVVSDSPVAIEMEEPIRDIEFKHVSFQYSDKVKVLDNVSFSLQQGECVAIVGSSGSGKSTMVNLVPRFYDTSAGSVCINNHDIRDYTLSSLRRSIGVVTQQTFLFNQSVAENISYGASDATQEDIIVAAKKANAHDFIMELDKGYDTLIGERATLLSGGMAQRLTIARALLKNPPILILDEATSSLDTESEKLVQEALDELMKDRTVLVIAHRLSTIRNADRIIVLDKGCIVEEGSHEDLYANGGSYRRLCDLQQQTH